jgi:hypothetical protein
MKRKPGGVISQLGEGVNEMSDTLSCHMVNCLQE